MRILIIGSEKIWACENYYIKHLREQGASVESFPAHDLFYDYYYKLLLNKVFFRLGLSYIFQKINRNLMKFLAKKKFDVIWIFKGMELFPETLKEMKKSGAKLVNFNPDHPFIHSFSGSGNKNVLGSIQEYDMHLCYNLSVKERLEQEFKIPAAWLPFGFENVGVKYPTEEEETKRACFVGNPDKKRVTILTELAEKGIPLSLYGNDWENWITIAPHYDIKIYNAIYKEEFNKILYPYRLHLNIFREHNYNSHNMRSFEIPGLGGILLAPESKENNFFFKDKKEMIFYRDLSQMVILAKEILQLPYEMALEIRKGAYSRSIKSGYAYESRTKQVLTHFQKLVNAEY